VLDPTLEAACRGALALLLISAAWHKARDARAFRATLSAYGLLPPAAVGAAALLVIAAEVVTAAALLVSRPRSVGPLLAAALLVVYTAAITINLVRGRRDIDCGCGGGAGQPLGWWLVGRNGMLVAAALVCLLPPRPRPSVWVDVLTVTGTVAVVAALWTAIMRLIAAAPRAARLRERA
jgi:hypothetical protein